MSESKDKSGGGGSSAEEGQCSRGGDRLVVRLLALAWQYRWGCLKILGIQFCLLVMGLSGLGLTGLGIDIVRYSIQKDAAPPRWPLGLAPPSDWHALQGVYLVAGGVLLLAITRALLNGWYTISMAKLLQGRIVVDLRQRVYDKLQRLSFRFFDANTTGSLINRVTSDVQNVRLFIDGVVVQTIILTVSLCIYLVSMTHIHLALTAACLATTPLIYIVTRRFSRVVQPAYRKERELFDDVVLTLNESIRGMHVVKGFARQKEQMLKFASRNQRLTEHKKWIFVRATTYPQVVGLLTQFNIVVLIVYGGWLVIHKELPLGTGLVFFAGLLQQFSGQVTNLANVANTMQQSLIAARRVFEVLDTPIEVTTRRGASPLKKARGAVEFRSVSFGYTPLSPILRDISFRVEPGMRVAVLGTTGSGKTTLLSLIPRFYDVQHGQVLVDGQDVRQLDLDDLRRNIGVVFQESFLFSQTVAQNICFGHPSAAREQVERAAKIAAADRFIITLPNKYDTVLREAGADLSGGQRQRLAIARALLLEPAILLLDDPTAAIDARTEHEILEAMESAMKGRTTFVIAHRLSTLKTADLILVLQRGRIVQSGTHEELMRQDGAYRLAARLQVADDTSRLLLGMGKEMHG